MWAVTLVKIRKLVWLVAELWVVYPIENSEIWENGLSLWLNVVCVPLLKKVKIVKIRKWFWFFA